MIYGQETDIELMEDTVTVRNEIAESRYNNKNLNVLLAELNLKELEEVNTSRVDHVSNSDINKKHKNADLNKTCDGFSESKVADVLKTYRKNGIDTKSRLLYLMGLMDINDIDTFHIIVDRLPGELLDLSYYDIKLIHFTSHYENVTFTKSLIEAGQRVDCKGVWDETPLHLASRCGNTNVVKLLIDINADMLLKSRSGLNAIDWAKYHNHPQIVKYLQDVLKVKGKVDGGNYSNKTFEQMKQKGLARERNLYWWNNMKKFLSEP